MRITNHLIASTIFSSGVYLITKSPVIAASSFFVGIFLDLDHLIDYWRQHPGSLDVKHFVETCEKYRLKILTLFFHSYELLLIVAALVYFTKSSLIFGAALGFAQHLLLDSIGNKINSDYSSYFFIYRWKAGFEGNKIFSHKEEQNGQDNNI